MSVVIYGGMTRVEMERISEHSKVAAATAEEKVEQGTTMFKQSSTYRMAFVPSEFESGLSWKLVTYQFTHASWGHLFSNMWYFLIFGWILENAIGSIAFLSFTLLFAALAVLSELVFQADLSIPIIGASGSVAFIMGAVAAMFPRSKVRLMLFFIPLPNFPNTFFLPLRVLIYIWVLFQISGLAQNIWLDPKPVAFATHLSGFGLGIAAGLLFRRQIRRRKNSEKWVDIELSGRDLKTFYQGMRALNEQKVEVASATLESISDKKPWMIPLQLQLFRIAVENKLESVSSHIWKNVLPSLMLLKRSRDLEWMLDSYLKNFGSLPEMVVQEQVQLSRLLKPFFDRNEQLSLHLQPLRSQASE